MQKKKIVIIVVLILMVLGAAGTYIYFYTDLFKSDKDLFYKYLLNKNEMFSIGKNISIEKNNESYKKDIQLETIYEYDNSIEKVENDQIIKNLEKNIKDLGIIKDISAKVEEKVDKENKNSSYNIEFKKLDEKIIDIEAIRNEDKYAIKSDDVLKKYIGIENSDIKDFAQKLELPMAEYLPQKLDYDSQKYKDLIAIDEEEKKHIKEVYYDLLYEQIDKACYSKEKNVEIQCADQKIITNKYILTLNNEQSINLAIKILERLKQDSITLNLISTKIKTVLPESEYVEIYKLNEVIQKYIDSLNNIEKNQDEYIKINVYEKSGSTLKIEVLVNNEKRLDLDYKKENDEEKIFINQSFIKNDSGAIVYDIKTSLSGANNIIIGRKGNMLSIEAELYDIKDIYQSILNETKSKYEEQKKQTIDEDKEILIKEDDVKELEKIFNEYSNFENPELLKITLKIEYSTDDNNENQNSIYLKVCNSKIGLKMKSKKETSNDIGEIEKLTNENCVILNSYTKQNIEAFIDLYIDKMLNVVKEKIK